MKIIVSYTTTEEHEIELADAEEIYLSKNKDLENDYNNKLWRSIIYKCEQNIPYGAELKYVAYGDDETSLYEL